MGLPVALLWRAQEDLQLGLESARSAKGVWGCCHLSQLALSASKAELVAHHVHELRMPSDVLNPDVAL